ncbi:MAG: hypothetical protein EBR82_66340 [Caulobacteraceae bacterium]|nr:hypothetical protein [Caulobacteraceae bacterium]
MKQWLRNTQIKLKDLPFVPLNQQKTLMKLKDIKPNPNNPRVLRDDKFAKLKQSISEFPKMLSLRPMVIDENNMVLGGNMRLRALQDLGYTDIDDTCVKYAKDLTEEEKQRFIIADNVAFGEWDWDTLANNWESDQLSDWGLDIPNWSNGLDVNSMTDDDVDINEEFDPIGNSSGVRRLIILFDNDNEANDWVNENHPNLKIEKIGISWRINLSTIIQ